MEHFTPFSSLAGGMLIGIAATILLLFNGKILGVSGIISKALFVSTNKELWRIVFLIGLVSGALLFRLFTHNSMQISIDASIPVIIVAGLLVGFGTRLGSGCTSGHGICGIARFSKRSIAATITFMLTGIIAVYIVKHILAGIF